MPVNTTDIDTFALCVSGGSGKGCGLQLGVSNTAFDLTASTKIGRCNCGSGKTPQTAGSTKSGCQTGTVGCKDDNTNALSNGTWVGEARVNASNRDRPEFTVGAIGNLGGGQNDEWTMNQTKTIVNVQDGVR